MKKKVILMIILLFVVIVFSGCGEGRNKIDLDDYHQCGEHWSITCDESEYNLSYISCNDSTLLIDIEIVDNSVNVDKIYVFSKGYKIIYNDEFCYESVVSMPMLIPVGLYELPVEGNYISFKIITDKQDFNGYVQVTLEKLPTYGGPKQAMRFKVY